MRAWLGTDRGRSWLVALGCYVCLLITYGVVAGTERLTEHTPYNHFALLAEAWLDGRLDLGKDPPDYAHGNDFAHYGDKWYVPFPALPAALLLPLVYFAGSAERVRDGQFFVWLAPLGPVLLFFALEKLRRLGRSERSRLTNLGLSLGFALGSVYFFTAVQGTVWFAAHVVAVALAAAYVLFAIDARRPVWAGLMLGLAYWTRAPLLFAAPLFVFEAWRASRASAETKAGNGSSAASLESGDGPSGVGSAAEARRLTGAVSFWQRCRVAWAQTDVRRFSARCALFALPLAVCFGLSLLHNQARFDDPFDVGYRHLQVAWHARISKWGLFHYHYLAKNLAVVLTSLPWIEPLRINAHGVALWLTTPMYLYLLCARRRRPGYAAMLVTAACVGVPALFYQNTGWMQFGYRFSNDYAVFLFCGLALCGRRLGPLFWALTLWAVLVNAFGAVTFDRARYARFYYQQPSQGSLHQPD